MKGQPFQDIADLLGPRIVQMAKIFARACLCVLAVVLIGYMALAAAIHFALFWIITYAPLALIAALAALCWSHFPRRKKPRKDDYHPLPGYLYTLVIGVLIILSLPDLYVEWVADPWNIWTPSDNRLVHIFQRKKADFITLAKMFVEEKDKCPNPLSPSVARTSIACKRGQEYARLMENIGAVKYITAERPSVPIEFVFAEGGEGPLGDDWFKGIAYIPDQYAIPGKIVDSIDALQKGSVSDLYLVKIEPNWYVMFDEY